jgi:hypothetical protein
MGCVISKEKLSVLDSLKKKKSECEDLHIQIQNLNASKGKIYEELEYTRKVIKELREEKFEQFCEYEKELKKLRDKNALLLCHKDMYKEQVDGVIEKYGVAYANACFQKQ